MRILIIAALVLLGPAAGRATADVVTASFLSDTMNAIIPGGPCGSGAIKCQTFTAEQSGQLRSVALRMYADAGFPGLRVSVRAMDANNLPNGDELCSEVFATDTAPTAWPAALATFTFTGTTPTLQAGTEYGIVVESADTASPLTFTWNGAAYADATYAGGRYMQRSCDLLAWGILSYDMGFQVIVDETVPNEASSWGGVKALFR